MGQFLGEKHARAREGKAFMLKYPMKRQRGKTIVLFCRKIF